MNARRYIIPIYVVVMAALILAAGSWFMDARNQYEQLKLTEANNRRILAEARARLQEQERTMERLRSDPAHVEKVLRQRLGYARPGDVIFRFED